LSIFIVADPNVPTVVDELVDTLLGKVIVIGGALALLFAHPLIGALGIVAAYRLISQSHSPAPSPPSSMRRSSPLSIVPSTQSQGLNAFNQFPMTVEEEVIQKMIPTTAGNLPPATFKPVLDKLHDAARLN
jgi:hypothetical protein